MAGFDRPNGGDGAITEINLTPLIDVCLVLVVILLVATPLAFESAIAVRSAAAAGRKSDQKAKDERIEVRVLNDATVSVNREEVPRGSVGARLRPLLETSATRKVVVTCEPGVTHGAFVHVLDQAKLSGAADIAVLGK
jgi:biopolymer transport protein ExbD